MIKKNLYICILTVFRIWHRLTAEEENSNSFLTHCALISQAMSIRLVASELYHIYKTLTLSVHWIHCGVICEHVDHITFRKENSTKLNKIRFKNLDLWITSLIFSSSPSSSSSVWEWAGLVSIWSAWPKDPMSRKNLHIPMTSCNMLQR